MIRAISIRSYKPSKLISLVSTNKLSSAAPATHGHHEVASSPIHPRIGRREIVGYGINGQPAYFDHAIFPMPAVRWAEDDEAVAKLRQKARGDWSSLTVDEKKALYRADFRETFSEFVNKTNGEWKFTWGMILGLMGTTLWLYTLYRSIIYNYPRLETSSFEHQTRMLERMIAQGAGRVHGVSSEWDYEKGTWKKN